MMLLPHTTAYLLAVRQGHGSLESDATLYGQSAGTALVGSLLPPHAQDAHRQHSGLRAAAAAGWDPRTHSLQALLHQVCSSNVRP